MSDLIEKAKKVKEAAPKLAFATTDEKNQALALMAEQLILETPFIIEANQQDLQTGRNNLISESMLDRLALTPARIQAMSAGLKELIQLPDPIGDILERNERPNGLIIEKVRVPLGVIGMIYEARPNVTVDAAGLCLKAGNTVLLRGSSSAIHSNQALIKVLHHGLEKSALPKEAVQLLEDTSLKAATCMLKLNQYLDVLIPRGGPVLIQSVVNHATVPVIQTGVGNCHLYIDASADPTMACAISINAKVQRPSVCNAAETILVHEEWAATHLMELITALREHGVTIYADEAARQIAPNLYPASERDWQDEYLDLCVALKVVPHLQAAMKHIQTYGTKHSEAIITENLENATIFLNQVDAAAVYHNASTRFTDGTQFGYGAEMGISTQKLHVRGPIGLTGLTSTKYIIHGTGQIRG